MRSLDWLTMGTCEIDLGGTASDADPLDREGPTYEDSGELVRLPLQRFCWTICHQRVLGFEVQRGPGLGTGLLARRLELTAEPVAADRRPADREGPPEATRSGDEQAAKPSIEDLIEEARASRLPDTGGR
ncbi:hypothetical protein BRD56_11415 [Thermoplasmatales archaeon SW_10_69_26]|nr:MAG: hypothetical protein BRD56_11415 [Thermoplasmatales archaeon SW_10_69_26]